MRVLGSLALPAKNCTRRTNPLASQCHQRAVAAALLAAAAFGFVYRSSPALEVGVGQVVQRDRLAQAEHRAGTTEQVLLQGLAVLVQRVRGAVQTVQVHRLEVKFEQLTQRRLVLQPSVRCQFAARQGHARDDVANSRSDLRTVQAQLCELVLKTALAHRRQRSVLDAHAARVDQFERVQIHLLVAIDGVSLKGRLAGRQGSSSRGIGQRGASQVQVGRARNDLGSKALRQGLHLLGQGRIGHGTLPVQQLVDALG
ncbi:hypothetical protein [Verminephrobacter aporrectodeae]|uniref:hypothetical protein n=1 Tax=Verminephrobacter aporrectodeae TaxID=1110389 RepID=UPI0022377D4B|nr:hypothetical protein [Verminephrobacter aporrectodeae]